MKKEGKGRPVHGYRLSKDFDEILEEIIQDLEQKIEDAHGMIFHHAPCVGTSMM